MPRGWSCVLMLGRKAAFRAFSFLRPYGACARPEPRSRLDLTRGTQVKHARFHAK